MFAPQLDLLCQHYGFANEDLLSHGGGSVNFTGLGERDLHLRDEFLSCDSCCAPAMFRFHDTVCTQPVQENMHSPRRKIFAYLCQPLSCMYCLLPAKCRFHFTVGSQHEQDRTKDVPTEPHMRGGGKNASSATENRLLEGLRELLKTVDETPSHTQAEIGGEAKLLADLKNLIHQHKKGCLLQQLKSLVTQATRSQHVYSEPG